MFRNRLPQFSRTAVALLAAAGLLPALAPLSAPDAKAGWIQIFDGETKFGWIADSGDWRVENRSLVSNPASAGRLRTDTSFSDFDLQFEARFTGPAALIFRADPATKPAQPGFRLSLNNGEIAGLSAPKEPAPNGSWNAYEIIADQEHITVSINGKPTADLKSGKNRVGFIALESDAGSKLELRSLRLKPLDLDKLYNGSNLDGWKAVAAPAPQQNSKLKLPIPGLSHKPKPPKSVTWTGNGNIHGESGQGQLESASAYDDFVLQFSARTTGQRNRRPSATLILRGDAGQFTSGYAVGLDNGQPKQFGIGGLENLQAARTAAASDGSPFAMTIIGRAHRFSVWVNGLLVTDYYDARPEGQYRPAAGPFAFRIQDPDVKLDLQDVAAAVLPKGPQAPPPPAPAVAAPPAVLPTASAGGATTAAPPPAAPIVLPPLESPEDKARKEQVRNLTAQALSASTPEEAIRINREILLADPSDVPAQQRLDKAQEKLDRATADQVAAQQRQQGQAAEAQANQLRRQQLLDRTQQLLIQGRPNEARQTLNDAERFGAAGSQVSRLRAIIESRLRDQLFFRVGIGSLSLCGLTAAVILLWRRRGRKLAPFLVAVDGAEKGRRYLLNQDVTHIGAVAMDAGKKNEILVHDPDRKVSRFHCEVHRRGDALYVIDLNSSNGTYLKNRRLQPGVAVRLKDGQRILLGNAVEFEVRLERVPTSRTA